MKSWRTSFSRRKWEHDLSEELRFHIEKQTSANISAGMDPDEARRQAVLQLGAAEGVKENCREQRRGHWFESVWNDVQYGLRSLRKTPSFTLVAVLSLALGIGVNVAIFTLAQEVLLQKLDVPHPDQLRMFRWTAGPHRVIHSTWGNFESTASGEASSNSFAYPVYLQLRKQNTVLSDLFAFKNFGNLTASVDGQAEAARGEFISGNYYEGLEIVPALGRPIQPQDDGVAGTAPVALISDQYWARRFGRSPSVIGKVVELNRTPVTVVGVNPPGFTGASNPHESPDFFLPFSMQPQILPNNEGEILTESKVWWMQVMGRVKPGVSDSTATAALDVVLNQAVRDKMTVGKDETIPRLILDPGNRGLNFARARYGQPTMILMALAGFVLLLACANLANLLLARASARQREMSVRLALGAGRLRIVRQVMTESLLLASLGGATGMFLGYLGRDIIPHLLSDSWEPTPFVAHFGWQILAFCTGVSLLSGFLFGLAPAWQASRTNVNSGVREGARATMNRTRGLVGKSLVVFQVSLSLVLVAAAGLFVRTLMNLSSVDPGFQPQHVLLFDIDPPKSRYPQPKDIALHHQIEDQLASVPGVESISASGVALVADSVSDTDFLPTETPKIEGQAMEAHWNDVGTNFFQTMKVPILYGRAFDSRDTETSPKVAIVNHEIVKEFFPHTNPIGKTFNKERFEIVGVCADTRYQNLREQPPPTFYVPYKQLDYAGGMTYEVRTHANPTDVLAGIRETVRAIDSGLPVSNVRTQTEQIAATLQGERIFATLTAGFGVLALLLAGIGIYGLMAYNVARRTNEIGIRMALGAQSSAIGRMILRETLALVVLGVAIGLACVWPASRVIASVLFGLSPHDPVTLAAVIFLLVFVGAVAGFVPSRRATHTDPMVALRHE